MTALSFGSTNKLETFGKIMTALKSGETVNMVFEYKKTKLFVVGVENKDVPGAIGGMTFSPWEYFAKGVVRNEKAYVLGSETHLIMHPKYKLAYNYVKTRIYEDDSVKITAEYLLTQDYTVVMDEVFKGNLSNGKDNKGISAFIKK